MNVFMILQKIVEIDGCDGNKIQTGGKMIEGENVKISPIFFDLSAHL